MRDIDIFTGDSEYIDDCIRIKNILKENGYNATLNQCEKLWQSYSDSMCAGWISLDKDDDSVFNNISWRIK